MRKIDWQSIWKFTLALAISLVAEVIVIVVAELKDRSIILFSGIALFFIALISIQFAWVGIEKQLQPIVQRWQRLNQAQKKKVFTLTRSQNMHDGIICFDLCNRQVKPSVTVSRIEIGRKDRRFSHREEDFVLNNGECREIPFIKVSTIYKYFSVVDAINEPDVDRYNQGKHDFDMAVIYNNGSIQWFYLTVFYTEPDKITLEISDE